MAATSGPTEAQIAHQELLRRLDIQSIKRTFRNPQWRPNQRRNKNVKTILADVSKKEAAAAAAAATAAATTATGSGTRTPISDDGFSMSGASTPEGISHQVNLGHANKSLGKLVLERNLVASTSAERGTSSTQGHMGPGPSGGNGNGTGLASTMLTGPLVTYANIESAPSMAAAVPYCDVTGQLAAYVDPKTRLRYSDREVFAMIRALPQTVHEQYLEARGAHTVLK